MTKSEIISQLKSLRDSTIDYMKGNDDLIFKKDIEALDATIDFLNQADREPLPEDELVTDCVPVIRCKDCKFSRGLRPERYKDCKFSCGLRPEDALGRQFIEGCIWCANWRYAVMPEDYCSNAKRKQN